MSYIAEIGEGVIYTGDLSYTINEVTANLMKRHLIKGCLYKVQYKHRFYGRMNEIVDHYKIKGFWAPCESFKLSSDFIRIRIKNKYNLK